MPYVTLHDDVRLHYETGGIETGSRVLLIMGFTIRGGGWRFVTPSLSEHHQVCWYDNRGCGFSDVPEPPYTMATMASDAIHLMDHLGWEDAHIVGASMGGMIAQHVALNHRQRVRSLSLIATTPGGFVGRIPSPAGLVQMMRGIRASEDKQLDALTKLLFPKRYREELGVPWIRETLLEDLTPRPTARGRKGQMKAVFGHDTRRRLGELEGLPTLIIKPEADKLIRPRNSEVLHGGIPGSTIVRLPDLGHGLVRHAGSRLSDPLLAHFAQVDAAA